MKKPENLDCVAVKHRAQRELAKSLSGKTPEQQAEILQRLAARDPLRKALTRPKAKKTPNPARASRGRRSA